MPRSKNGKLTITVPEPLLDTLEDMAHNRDMAMNKLVAQLIRLGIKSLEYPEAPKESPLRGVDPSGPTY